MNLFNNSAACDGPYETQSLIFIPCGPDCDLIYKHLEVNVCAAAFPQLISTQKWKRLSLGHLTYLSTDQIGKSRWMNDVLTSTLRSISVCLISPVI